jgi:hypothetical protein
MVVRERVLVWLQLMLAHTSWALIWDILNSRAIPRELHSCRSTAAIMAFLLDSARRVRGRKPFKSALSVIISVARRLCCCRRNTLAF